MKNVKILLLLSNIICSITFGISQNIVAGIVSVNDNYTDIIPDTNFHVNVAPHIYSDDTFYVDINKNGTNDFYFRIWGTGGLGGGRGSCMLYPISSTSEILTHSDTSWNYPIVSPGVQTRYIVNVPESLNYGDIIDNTLNFTTGQVYLWSDNYGPVSAPLVNSWNREGYIGVRIYENSSWVYGWIRISNSNSITGSSYPWFDLIIKDFSCENQFVSIEENALVNSNINIYPNPSPSGNFVLESEHVTSVELLSIDGKTIFTQIVNQPKTELRTGLPKGLYFAKITFENKKQVIQKLIVTQ